MRVRPNILVIAVSFILVTVAFVTASALTNRQLEEIDADARRLASTTMPAVERITIARSDLRELEAVLDAQVELVARGQHPSDDAVLRVLARARTDSDACVRSAAATAPRATLDDLPIQIAAASAASLHAVESAHGSDADAIRDEIARSVEPAVARADADLRGLIDQEILQAQSLARAMAAVRRRATHVTILLDSLCAGLAAAASVVVARTVSRHARLVGEHQRFLEARANELEEFSGRVAHDILSPLTAVSFAIAHAQRVTSDEAVHRSLSRGKSSLERVRTIVDALFEFARSGARPRPGAQIATGDVVADVLDDVAELAEAKNVTVRAAADPSFDVACDRGVLTSVLANLVRNAVKYMGAGQERRVTLRVASRGARVRFEVEDTGVGMSRGVARRVFEPYVRAPNASEPGIGLGLATVKRLVKSHGGDVGVETAPGRGSTFWFELPRA